MLGWLLAPVTKEGGGGGGFWLPESASSVSGETDWMFTFIFIPTAIAFLGIVATTVYFMIKYRRRSEGQRTSPIEGNTRVELAWTVIPGIFFFLFFLFGFQGWMKINAPPSEAIDVRVGAKKWSWEFTYPKDGIESGELVVPIGQSVKLTMSSEDVIHSFFIPAFRIKRDVLPNRYTVLWFTGEKKGTFDIYCTEYCGDGHSKMVSRVKVVSAAEYKKWVDSGGGLGDLPPAEFGKKLFAIKGCNQCHSVTKERMGLTGPPFGGAYGKMEQLTDGTTVKIDDNYIRESIMKPNKQVVKGYQPVMPTFAGKLKSRQINALIDYIKSLK